jgi:hypothetical protein
MIRFKKIGTRASKRSVLAMAGMKPTFRQIAGMSILLRRKAPQSSDQFDSDLRMSATLLSIAHERASDADGIRDVPPCLHPFTDRR